MNHYFGKSKVMRLIIVLSLVLVTNVFLFSPTVSAGDDLWTSPDTPIVIPYWGVEVSTPADMFFDKVILEIENPTESDFLVSGWLEGTFSDYVAIQYYNGVWVYADSSLPPSITVEVNNIGNQVEIIFNMPTGPTGNSFGFFHWNPIWNTDLIVSTFQLELVSPNEPPGWNKGKKSGWDDSVPPGQQEKEMPPPGFDKGNKAGWE